MLVNVVGHYDAKENVYPRRERPENKIDGAIALIMALGRYMVAEEALDIDEAIRNPIIV
jgi:phage terminase large subunit-like protein